MSLNSFAIASIVFLALYCLLFAYLVFNYATSRFTWKSRWSFLLFHVTIRLVAQAVGIGFGMQGFDATGLLVAFLILSAEGYFTLVICTLRLFVVWQRRYLPSHESWLEPRTKKKRSTARLILELLFFIDAFRSPVQMIHWLLVLGNVLIITGGTLLSGGTTSVDQSWTINADKLTASKAMRGAGQAVFLCITIFIHSSILRDLKKNANDGRGRIVLLFLLCTFPFMAVRGVFGICQGVVDQLNYYYPGIYADDGFTTEFVIKETVLATAMEWTTCLVLLSTSLLPSERKEEREIKDSSDEERNEAKSVQKELGAEAP